MLSQITIILAVPHRFRLAFESKVAEVDAAQTRLNTFTQRLIFAKRRVETIQGVLALEVNGMIAMLHFCVFFFLSKDTTVCLLYRFDHEESGSAENSAGQ